jgi:hypothetical protein
MVNPTPPTEPQFICAECGRRTDPEWWRQSGGLCGDCLAGHGYMACLGQGLDVDDASIE